MRATYKLNEDDRPVGRQWDLDRRAAERCRIQRRPGRNASSRPTGCELERTSTASTRRRWPRRSSPRADVADRPTHDRLQAPSIGYRRADHKQGTSKAHGEPLGADELGARQEGTELGITGAPFEVPADVLKAWREIGRARRRRPRTAWQDQASRRPSSERKSPASSSAAWRATVPARRASPRSIAAHKKALDRRAAGRGDPQGLRAGARRASSPSCRNC